MKFPVMYRGQVVQEYGALYLVLGYDICLNRTLQKIV